jgi:hypothetical protein
LWAFRSEHQIVLTALARTSPSSGPALTITGLVPDLDHYSGRGGRVFPLWRDAAATEANFSSKLLPFLAQHYGRTVTAEDFIAYIAATAAHPAFTARFQDDLSTPGLHIPITADAATFTAAAELGRTIVWLHTFGERLVDRDRDRPAGPPRLPPAKRPRIPAEGAIPTTADAMPDTLDYDGAKQRLIVGTGFVENIPASVWRYEVSGKQVLVQWFSCRKKNRERPIIGDRRPPSPLGNIQPDHWLADYTTELINVLNVLGWLVELEPRQAALLKKVCSGPTITVDELRDAGALATAASVKAKAAADQSPDLFSS